MADLATVVQTLPHGPTLLDRKLKGRPSKRGVAFFIAALSGGLAYIVFHVARDLGAVQGTGVWPYLLLGLALLIALGFEFVNGFHDTANAVATVIEIATRRVRRVGPKIKRTAAAPILKTKPVQSIHAPKKQATPSASNNRRDGAVAEVTTHSNSHRSTTREMRYMP